MAKITKSRARVGVLKFIGLDIEAASGVLADLESGRERPDPVRDAAESHPGLASFGRSAFGPQKPARRSR